jgi:hypothetical protein
MQSLVCEHDVFDWLGMLHGLTRVLTEVRAIQASNRGWQPPPVMT